MTDRLNQLLKMHEDDPADTFLTYGIAIEHANAENFGEAINWLNKTLTIDPLYCYAYFQKAKAYSELGEDTDAKAAIEAGINAAIKAGDDHARSELTDLLSTLDLE
ncbi:hypothetical protein [Poriferisphaera sp. WC338]|uniref:hypothetical protein n=1 Tax=Poriferisphaera sp. WC338 TaxID=3425129 RepID=UPI003D8150B8